MDEDDENEIVESTSNSDSNNLFSFSNVLINLDISDTKYKIKLEISEFYLLLSEKYIVFVLRFPMETLSLIITILGVSVA